jgi:hypothetical protein
MNKGSGTSFETGLDWSTPDSMTEEEAQALKKWYAESHGEGNLDLTPFVPMVIEYAPAAFKRYRRHVQAISEVPNGIPQAVVVLLFLHYYMKVGNTRGVLYEIIACRDAGITRQQVLDVIELTFLTAGPFSANAVAVRSLEYLERWDPSDDDESATAWPKDWAVAEPSFWESGMDFDSATISAEDMSSLLDWYRSVGEETPSYVGFLARNRPDILKTFRHRFEHAFGDSRLPKQMVPLFAIHRGVIEGNLRSVKEGALQARRFGVTKAQVLQTVLWGFLYADEATMNAVSDELDPIMQAWT